MLFFSSLLFTSAVAETTSADSLNLLQTRVASNADELALSEPFENACENNACDSSKEPSHSRYPGMQKEWFTVNGTLYKYKAYGRGIKPCKDANGIVVPNCFTIGCGGDGDMHMRYNWGCLNEKYFQPNWPEREKKLCTVRHNDNPADWQPWGLATWAQSYDQKVVVQIYQCAHYCSPANPYYVGADGINICPMQASMTMVGIKAGSMTISWGTSRDVDPSACTSANKADCGAHKALTDSWLRVNDEVLHPDSASSGWVSTTRSLQDPELGEILIVIRGWDIKVSGGAGKNNFFLAESVMKSGLVNSLITHMQQPLLDADPNGKSICTNVWDMDGGPNPGQAEGSPVLVSEGSAEYTMIFTQAEMESRCTACVWGRLAQMRAKTGGLVVDPKWSHQGKAFPATLEECQQDERYPGSCDAYYNPRDCKKPWAPGEPVPGPEDKCKETNCSFNFAQRLCAPLKGAPAEDNAYKNCMFDFCAGCDEQVFEEYKEIENFEHPAPTCVENVGNCGQEKVCSNSMTMSLEKGPSQNNLGGAGPDAGAAELRYSKAGTYNGKNLDLVVTADGYTPKNAANNGNKGQFGRINLRCGANAAFEFKWVDSETGEPVEVSDVSVTFYDMDEGKRGKSRNKISTCGASDLLVSSDSELTTEKRAAGCFSAQSSKYGQKKNEPENPLLLTEDQMSRSATFSFKDASSASFDATMAKCGGGGARNLQFAVRPTVACAGTDYSA